MQTSVKVNLYVGKTLKNGEHPVILRLIKDRSQIRLGLGLSCSPDMWDQKVNLPKRRHPLFLEIKTAIEKAKTDTERIILNLENRDIDYSLDDIKAKLTNTQNPTTVLAYIDTWVKRLTDSNRVGYAGIFHSTRNSLQGFCGKDFPFSTVNHAFLTRWEEYHMKLGTKPNGFFVYMRTFKTIINNARREDVVSPEYNPFKDISFSKFRRIETKRRAITKAQLQKLASLNLTEEPGKLLAQQLFFFSFYCRGINFVDMAHLKWTDIKEGRLYYTRKKTNEAFNMALLEPAVEILNYYKPITFNLPGNYVFPILSDFHKTETQKKDRIKKIIRQVNSNLKLIASTAEIDADLTTYVARHSFATILKQSGTPISQISELMGHDSESTTKIYLKSFEKEVLDEAVRVLL